MSIRVEKVSAVYRPLQRATGPMVEFDERDLFEMADEAGFGEV